MTVVRFPIEERIESPGSRRAEPATIVILPVIRIERCESRRSTPGTQTDARMWPDEPDQDGGGDAA